MTSIFLFETVLYIVIQFLFLSLTRSKKLSPNIAKLNFVVTNMLQHLEFYLPTLHALSIHLINNLVIGLLYSIYAREGSKPILWKAFVKSRAVWLQSHTVWLLKPHSAASKPFWAAPRSHAVRLHEGKWCDFMKPS